MNYERMWQGLKYSFSKSLIEDDCDIDDPIFRGLIFTLAAMQEIENVEKEMEKEEDKEAEKSFEKVTISIKTLKKD